MIENSLLSTCSVSVERLSWSNRDPERILSCGASIKKAGSNKIRGGERSLSESLQCFLTRWQKRSPGSKRIVASIYLSLFFLGWQQPHVLGQEPDVVVVQRAGQTLNRRGTIVEWKGGSLVLKTDLRDREIPNEEIVEIKTGWPANYLEARKSMGVGQQKQAVEQLASALKEEKRPWAQRIIRADLVPLLSLFDQHEAAIQQYLTILAEDPQSRFFYRCPLKWLNQGTITDPTIKALLNSPNPVEQLIGASWSIPGANQIEGTKVLEALTKDLDPRIQKYASTQLWRLRLANLSSLNERQLQVWEQKLSEFPNELRAGPWFLLGDMHLKLEKPDAALICLMRVPILHADQPNLSAAALYHASQALQFQGRVEEAKGLRHELEKNFGESSWMK